MATFSKKNHDSKLTLLSNDSGERNYYYMITPPLSQLKKDLSLLPSEEILGICLKLAKYKKENKEFLHYLLYHAYDEQEYILTVKKEITSLFNLANFNTLYLTKRSIRKILSTTNKYISYSKQKQTEVELLIHFCKEIKKSNVLKYAAISLNNIFDRQILKIKKALETLHEDLQHDYLEELNLITNTKQSN